MKRVMKKVSKKRLNEWVKWSLYQLDSRRVDPFMQGWRCARALSLLVEGIPEAARDEMARIMNEAEATLWKKTKDRR